MNVKIVAIIFIFINNFRVCQCVEFHNFSLYNIEPTEPEHLQFLQNLDHKKFINVIFWKKPYKLHESVQLLVDPKDIELFKERTQHYKLKADLLIKDIQSAFNNQNIEKILHMRADTYTWNTFHTLDTIYGWLAKIASKYPKKVDMLRIGQSVQGRDIYVMSVKTQKPKFAVIVEGGIHGNEWISVEVVTYLLDQLVSPYLNKYSKLGRLMKKYEWHLIPIVNPDGYLYSQTGDRLWRKNRRKYNNGFGVDLNRNFNYSFGRFGTSDNANDDYFSGPHAFSEPESKALAEFILQNKNNLRFYFSLHGYGQKIIIPYADRIRHIDNYIEAEHYGKQAIAKMFKESRVKYKIGSHYDTLGQRISGNTGSYVKKAFDIKYVYTFLLRDNGSYGYALPASQILPTCREFLTGITELMTLTQRKVELKSSGEQLTMSSLLVFVSVNFIL